MYEQGKFRWKITYRFRGAKNISCYWDSEILQLSRVPIPKKKKRKKKLYLFGILHDGRSQAPILLPAGYRRQNSVELII